MASFSLRRFLSRIHPLRWSAAAVKFVLRSIPRLYALALIVLISSLTYTAVRYLIVSLAVPQGPPPQVAALPARLSPDILQTDWTAWQALSATEHARSPLAHYHRLDSWIEPDKFNDCTRSGCHSPLPHAKRKELRAFLNLHATSMHCGVCHMHTEARPLPLAWYNLKTGRRTEAPLILDLYDRLTSKDRRQQLVDSSPDQLAKFVGQLREAARASQTHRSLEILADHFETVRPRSAGFERLVSEAAGVVEGHFRGEYGAKIALRGDAVSGRSDELLLGHPDTADAVSAWMSRARSVSDEQSERMLAAVHPLKREAALHCTDCHVDNGSLVDLAALGYPAARRDTLVSSLVFRMIEHITSGQPMHLPQIIPTGPAPGQ